jgi:hypothetical protein
LDYELDEIASNKISEILQPAKEAAFLMGQKLPFPMIVSFEDYLIMSFNR